MPRRLTLAEAPGISAFEGRGYPRATDARLVMLARGQADAPRATARTVDISVSGFSVDGPADLAVNERVWFALDLGGTAGLVGGRARVVRDGPAGVKGLHIERIPLRDHELVIRHVLGGAAIAGASYEGEVRSFPRIWATRPVTLALGGREAQTVVAQTLNFSAAGALLVGARELGLGDRVRMRFELSQHGPAVEVEGLVVREGPAGTRGVRFAEISPRDQELVARYCALHHHD